MCGQRKWMKWRKSPQVIKAGDGAVCPTSETDSAERGGGRWNVTYDLHHPPPCARAVGEGQDARACSGLPSGARHSNRHQHEIADSVRGGGPQSVPVTSLEPHVSCGDGGCGCGAGMQGPALREPTTAQRACTTLQRKRDGNGVGWAAATERGHVEGAGETRNETLGLLVLPTRRPVSPAPPAPLCVRSGGGEFPGTSRAFGCLRRASWLLFAQVVMSTGTCLFQSENRR